MFNRLLIFLIFFSFVSVYSQEANSIQPSVQLKVRVQKDKILVRWAADSPIAWKRANAYGYIVERVTLKRDGQLLEKPEVIKLTTNPIKPAPFASWENVVANNDNAAIAAQAIYGESFEVQGEQGELAKIVNKAQELEQRFAFALFAADMDFSVAKMAGLGYVDTTAKSNEEYLYRVSTAIPKEILVVSIAKALANLKDFEELPAPIDLRGVYGDKNVLLTWEYELFKPVYNAYFVEKSSDGKNFKRLNEQPLVNMNDKPNAPAKRMYYVDSLAQNDKDYFYRVQGISTFGEIGPYSKIIKGKGLPVLPYTPHISRYGYMSDSEARIQWEFPKEGEELITSFELNWATKDEGPYTIVKKDIKPSQREVKYSGLKSSNYFKITAVGKNGSKRTSFSTLIQPIDSIPPEKPTGLKGVVDSLGVTTITWTKNKESDLLGYRVFRGNLKNEEYSQITIDPIAIEEFTDTVKLASLNSKVFYTVVAVDKRFNMSEYSTVLELKKPDIVPPSSPIFTSYKVKDGMVLLEWVNSTSDDVASHRLLRKNMTDDGEWEQIIENKDTTSFFNDEKILLNKTYRYSIEAVDSSGLKSVPTTPITVTVTSFKLKEVIKSFNSFVDRENQFIEIFWKADNKSNAIYEYMVYKAKDEEQPVLWKTISVNTLKLLDTNITPNSTYKYHIRAVFKNGKYSAIKSLNVKY